MNRKILIAMLSVLIALFACHKDNNNVDVQGDDSAATDDDSAADDDTNADDDTGIPGQVYDMKLAFEFKDEARLIFTQQNMDIPNASINVKKGNDLIPGGVTLMGAGKEIQVPEGDMRILTIKFAAPSTPSGRCGNQPVSLVAALTATANNDLFIGGISARCGADNWTSRPVQILRVNGKLTPAKKQ